MLFLCSDYYLFPYIDGQHQVGTAFINQVIC
jgi:hypothetical protein